MAQNSNAQAADSLATADDEGIVLNEEQAYVQHIIEVKRTSVVVIGAAGTGKTLTIVHAARRWLKTSGTAKVLMVAPYNTQVDKLYDDISSCPFLMEAVEGRLFLKTAASAFNFPMNATTHAKSMAAGVNPETRELLQSKELLIIMDEAALLKWINRDEISVMLGIVRGNPLALDGGAVILEVADPCQGLSELSKEEKQRFMVNGVLQCEGYVEGTFMADPRREKVFYTEVRRFVGPLKDVYEAGANDLRYGDTGPKARAMIDVASKREFTDAEDLKALTLYGTSKEVVDEHVSRTVMRAAARGQTVANGGVYIYRSEDSHKYGERQLNSLRPWGFETLALAVGERMLLIVKAKDCVGGAGNESEEGDEAEEETGVRFEDGKYASGNMVCEVMKIVPDCYVRVKVLRRTGNGILHVPWKRVEKNGVELDLIGLKPYYERVVDLSQGLETTDPVHVVARRIFGRGKFYVAVTRCKDLRQLKITGVETFSDLRRVVKSSWRVLWFLKENGVRLPAMSRAFAEKERAAFERLCVPDRC